MKPSSPDSRPGLSKISLLVITVAVLCCIGMLLRQERKPAPAQVEESSPPLVQSEVAPPSQPMPEPVAVEAPAKAPENPYDVAFRSTLNDVLAALDSGDWQVRHDALEKLAQLLKTMPRDDAIRLSAAYLQSGDDKAIPGQRFTVSEKNDLAENPSLRVFFMDQLGQLCKDEHRPEADQIARQVLSEKKSADEWAISLRNVAWYSPEESRSFIGDKTLEMVRYQTWSEKPSQGFLEAMDGLIYGRQLEAVTDLNKFMDTSEDNLLHHVGKVGFSRMADEFPEELAGKMNQPPELLSEHPDLRADVFAKMDITNPGQLNQLESYLGRADVSAEEKSRAVTGLLCPTMFKFFGLLNDPTPITESWAGAQDRWNNIEALIQKWDQNSQFPDLAEAFDKVKTAVSDGRILDEMAVMRDDYNAKYMATHPGVPMNQIPPLVFNLPTPTPPAATTPTPMPYNPPPSTTAPASK